MTSWHTASALGRLGGLILILGCGAGPPPSTAPSTPAPAPPAPPPVDPCPPLPYAPDDAADGADGLTPSDIAAISAMLGEAYCSSDGPARSTWPDHITGFWRQGRLVLATVGTASGRRAPTVRLSRSEGGWVIWDEAAEAGSTAEQQARLGRWLASRRDVDGLYTTPLPETDRWWLARLDTGQQSEVCVYTADGEVTRCWADIPGLAVIGHIPVPADPGPGRLLLWIAPEEQSTGPVAYRVLELETGRLCMGGEIDRGQDGAPADGVLPDPAPCPPSAATPEAPEWLDLTRGLVVRRVGAGPVPLGLHIGSDLHSPLEQYPRSLCLSGPERARICRPWTPPGDGGFDVDVIGVGPPVGDPLRWPVQVRINWIGSTTDMPAEDDGVLILMGATADGWREEAAHLPIGTWSRARYLQPEGIEVHRRATFHEPTMLDEQTVSLTLAESSASRTIVVYSQTDEEAEPEVTEEPVPLDDAPHKCCVYDGAAWQCAPRRCPKQPAGGGPPGRSTTP